MARQTGIRPPELEGPDLPLEGERLWGWFLELAGRRGVGAMGPAPLTYPDLDAWARLTRREPAPWEIWLLGRLDDTWLASVTERTTSA